MDRDGCSSHGRTSWFRTDERRRARLAARIGPRTSQCALGRSDSPLVHSGCTRGQTLGPVVGRVVGDRTRRCGGPLPPLAVAPQQTGITGPHRGGGPRANGPSRLQRPLGGLGGGLCALDPSRSASGSPAVVAGGIGDTAALAAFGPAPLFLADAGGAKEPGLVEQRRRRRRGEDAELTSHRGERGGPRVVGRSRFAPGRCRQRVENHDRARHPSNRIQRQPRCRPDPRRNAERAGATVGHFAHAQRRTARALLRLRQACAG